MIRHIYVHTSYNGAIRALYRRMDFMAMGYYSVDQLEKCLPKEKGYADVGDVRLHVLVGQIDDPFCPWCGSEPIRIDEQSADKTSILRSFLLCKTCGSRGPLLDYNIIADDADFHDVTLQEHYLKKRAWDAQVKNPYETEF
jgi:hypothetical protein